MTVEKPKAKQFLWPITAGANSATNQSEFLAISRNSLKAREKWLVHGATGIGFASHWLKIWRKSLKPITKRSDGNHVITFDSHLKTTLLENCLTFLKNSSKKRPSFASYFSLKLTDLIEDVFRLCYIEWRFQGSSTKIKLKPNFNETRCLLKLLFKVFITSFTFFWFFVSLFSLSLCFCLFCFWKRKQLKSLGEFGFFVNQRQDGKDKKSTSWDPSRFLSFLHILNL